LADLAECHGAKGAAKGSLSFTNLDGASRDRFRWKRLAWDFLSYPSCDQRLQAHIVNYALWLFVLGPIWAGVYFVTFYFLIRKLNLVTPGREAAEEAVVVHSAGGDEFSLQIVRALGERSNIVSLDACITLLRVKLKDSSKVSADKLKALGAAGIVMVGDGIQAIFGTRSDVLKTEIGEYLKTAGSEADEVEAPSPVKAPAQAGIQPKLRDPLAAEKARSLIKALGGKANIQRVDACAETRSGAESCRD
jgi:glucose PTS system EIICB or EIICBA component